MHPLEEFAVRQLTVGLGGIQSNKEIERPFELSNSMTVKYCRKIQLYFKNGSEKH